MRDISERTGERCEGENPSIRRITASTAPTACRDRDHQSPRVGALERGERRVGIREPPDDDHIGVLMGRGEERRGGARGVDTDLPLVDDRALVDVEHLDRLLDRHDMTRARRVELIDHRGNRRRAPRPGKTRHQDEAGSCRDELGGGRREAERVDRRDTRHDAAQHEADAAALAERADAEPAGAGIVHGIDFDALGQPPRGFTEHQPSCLLGVARLERVELALDQHTVDPQVRAGVGLQVQVGGTLLDREAEQSIEIQHRGVIGRWADLLDARLLWSPSQAPARAAAVGRAAAAAFSGRRRKLRLVRQRSAEPPQPPSLVAVASSGSCGSGRQSRRSRAPLVAFRGQSSSGAHRSAAASTTADPGPPVVAGSTGKGARPSRTGSVAATHSRTASRS